MLGLRACDSGYKCLLFCLRTDDRTVYCSVQLFFSTLPSSAVVSVQSFQVVFINGQCSF